MKAKIRFLGSIAVFALLTGSATIALGYSFVVGLGDSLTDNGNAGRYTDGPVWVELLADHYSVPLVDLAYGGATTGYDNPAHGLPITGLQWQVDELGPVPPGSLVTVWAGANDLLQLRSPLTAAVNIDAALEKLYLAGGRNFIVPNLPDIGNAPSVAPYPTLSAAADLWTRTFNDSLSSLLQEFQIQHGDVALQTLDAFGVFNQYPIGSAQWSALFWVDGFHPSALGHQMIYDAAVRAFDPVPEPATALLFVVGLSAIIAVGIRRRNDKSP